MATNPYANILGQWNAVPGQDWKQPRPNMTTEEIIASQDAQNWANTAPDQQGNFKPGLTAYQQQQAAMQAQGQANAQAQAQNHPYTGQPGAYQNVTDRGLPPSQLTQGSPANFQAGVGMAQSLPQNVQSQPSAQSNPYLGSTGAPAASQYTAPQVATSAGQANPYLPDIGNAITGAVNQNLMQNIMPAINRNSVATGGYGGSRQGVAQGVAAGNASTGLSQALASMYGGAWDSQQARDLSKYGMDQSNATSRYGIDTTAGTSKYLGDLSASTSRYGTDVGAQTTKYGYDTNAATSKYGTDSSSQIQNRNIDLNQNQQGYNQFWDTIKNQLGIGTAQTAVGNEQMAASKDPLNTYSNLVNPYTGLGGTKTTTDPATGGGAAGALGGAMSMAQLYDLIFGGKKP